MPAKGKNFNWATFAICLAVLGFGYYNWATYVTPLWAEILLPVLTVLVLLVYRNRWKRDHPKK